MRSPLPGGWGAAAVVAAHTFNDMYLPALSILVPVLAARHGLSLTQAIGLATAFSTTAFFLQPLLGLWLDRRRGARLATASSLLCALAIAALVPPLPYPLLLAIAALGGIGSAIFHPHGGALLAGAPGPRQSAMGWYGSSGNFGIALTPLLLPPLVEAFGLENCWPWLLAPALLSLTLLAAAERSGLRYSRRASLPLGEGWGEGSNAIARTQFRLGTHVWLMLPLVAVVALRNWTNQGMTTLLPLHHGQAGGWLVGTRQVSLMLLAGALGAVAGGYLARRFGTRRVTALSLAASSVFFGLLIATGDAWALPLMAAGGGLLMTSFALTVLLAQEMLPSHRAYAAGLSFGLGSGLAGLGLGLTGWLAELLGLATTITMLAALPLAAALLALRLPVDREGE